MELLLWIIFGALAGWIASLIMHSEASHGLLTDIILGIAGAVIGGMILNLFGQSGVTGFNFYSILVAVFGAVILIGLGRVIYR